MIPQIFNDNVVRLQNRYGTQVFDVEFSKILWMEVRDIPDKNFKRMIDLMIGEFPNPAWPPKMSDFRNFANAQRQALRAAETADAAKNWNANIVGRKESEGALDSYLKNVGVKSLLDAINKKRGSHED